MNGYTSAFFVVVFSWLLAVLSVEIQDRFDVFETPWEQKDALEKAAENTEK